MRAWLWAFLLTQAIEVPIYWRAVPGRRRLWVAFGASALTHPVVFFAFPALWPGGYWSGVSAAEAFAVGAEAAWLSCFGARLSVAWALAANAASLGFGLTTRAIWGFP